MASSSTSSMAKSFKYDVFLSFRGEDTRKNFVDHLYHALQQKSIHTYKDDERIKKGERISDELIGSIKTSKFYIIVFSKNYASSSWCLDELVKIMECHRTTEHTAYPVFYDVEPSDVRKQSGAVKDAFAKHEKEEAAGKWREALKEAADLAGWELKNTADGHEAKFIQKIVEELSLELRLISFNIDEKLVGMETRIRDVLTSLETGIDDVRMIGIKGMGGGGKTTLARAVFDHISFQFEGKSFVENVREVSNASSSGLKSLQNQVLSDVLNGKGVNVSSLYDGKHMMKKMMSDRKVLVVLDDVDNTDQLEALAGEPDWYKAGSVIIITTRDEQVLVAHRVKLIHDVNLLSDEEAICLFDRYAFGREIPIQGYKELSKQVVRYAAGLPLTIRVLGSFLCGKNELEWVDAIERLKTIPLAETLKKLELSFISLEEDYKEIFLDIACILKGWKKDIAIKALESCGFHAKNGLRVLEQRSLITISFFDKRVGMHDHIEEMGRNIVRRLHPGKPHKHSRLWIDDEIEEILANDLGTKATRCLRFDAEKFNQHILIKGLRKMKELRFLSLNLGDCSDDFECSLEFPNALRYLHLSRYPFRSLPNTFQANNLVSLKMADSRIVQLWEGEEIKVLNKLRFLDLSSSRLSTFDLRHTPNLETLNLSGCSFLVEVYMLIGCLKLSSVDLSLTGLRTLDLRLAPNLETLNLFYCCDLIELDMPGRCLRLRSLILAHSKLRTLDIGLTPNLENLDLQYCYCLEELHMGGECQKLTKLYISHSKLRTLDIGLTPNLENLDLQDCYCLEELHMGGECQKLTKLDISHSKLRNLDLGLTPNLKHLDLNECCNLVELHIPIGCLENLVYFCLSGCLSFRSFLFEMMDEDGPIEDCLSADRLHLIAKPLESCPFHPYNNFPKLQISCLYEDDRHPLTGNPEMLFSVGMCACINLQTFSRRIYGLRRISTLTLEGMVEVPGDIGQLEGLENLTLSSAKIEHLPDSIYMLKNLKSLELVSCLLLEKLPEDLGRLECLEKLTLSSSTLKNLPDSICMLKRLQSLELIFCWLLEKLPEDIGRLEYLKNLTLSSAKIKHLPDSICMLKRIESLKLKSCLLLEELPKDVGQLECLEKLTLSSTNIKHLPDSICILKHLKSLKLNYCLLLEELPGDLCGLESLEYLHLSYTNIKHLPDSICMLKHLKSLNLTSCLLLEELPGDLGGLECLEYLHLSNTNIKHLPDSICMLKHLKSLNLTSCLLLEELPGDLGGLECLKYLHLSNTNIKHLPDSICMLKHLKSLILDHCSLLEKLPEELGCSKHLINLNIGGTRISYLPQSVVLLGGLCIIGSRELLESCGFTPNIYSETFWYVDVPRMQGPTAGVSSTVLHG